MKQESDGSLELDLPPGTGIDEEESVESAEIITKPFDPTLIRVERTNPTIELLTRRIRHNEIDLSPDFQRKAGIWSQEAQSRLIESILIRIPLPAFYVDATDENHWLVVDGLQRLTAFQRFIVDSDSFELRGMEFLHNLEGKRFSDLPRSFQRRIEETEVTVFQIQAGTPDAVKFNIFKRINTGGLPLSAQEIRNALNGTRVRTYLGRLSTSDAFLSATSYSIRDKRMADRECVVRYLAFILQDPSSYNSNDFDAFLNLTMQALNDPIRVPDDHLQELEHQFYDAMELAKRLFGRYAFRKYYGMQYRLSPINKALFEAWSVNLAIIPAELRKALLEKREILLKRFAELMQDNGFQLAISQGTGAPSRVRTRFKKIGQLIGEVTQ